VNVKLSHGLTQKSVAVDAAAWLADQRFTHSTFHWLTKTGSGEAQANYAYQRMVELGADHVGYAHVVDVEETGITATQFMDYVLCMTTLLGRPIATYTGDWYWPKSWMGANISPWLHAAPNGGYLRTYPGDTGDAWMAGYGGWQNMTILQYAVEKINGIAVSMSAVRDHALWNEMRGVMPTLAPCLNKLRSEFNAINPNRDKSSDGWIGDPAHAARKSDHNADTRGIVHAIDVDETGPWDGETMAQKVERLRLRCKGGQERRLTYIIYEGRICSPVQDWTWRPYDGASPHDKHAHVSCSYLPSLENDDVHPFGVAKPLPPPKEEPVTQPKIPTAAEIADAVVNYKVWNPYSQKNQELKYIWGWTPSASWHQETQRLIVDLAAVVAEQGALLRQVAAGEELDDAALQRIENDVTAIRERVAATPEVPEPGNDGTQGA
jgi:hypothetical protein